MVVVLALLTGACGGDGEGEAESTITIAGQMANDHGQQDVTGADGAGLELGDFYFQPTVLIGTPGQAIELVAENTSEGTHSITIPEQGVDHIVEPGGRERISVTFPATGVVAFICRFHAASGMVGGLVSGGVSVPPGDSDGSDDLYDYG